MTRTLVRPRKPHLTLTMASGDELSLRSPPLVVATASATASASLACDGDVNRFFSGGEEGGGGGGGGGGDVQKQQGEVVDTTAADVEPKNLVVTLFSILLATHLAVKSPWGENKEL